MRLLVVALSVLIASTALAQPRAGANHHLGDDSFVAAFGRPPGARDSEPLRMRTHLTFIRDRLVAGAPTDPALAARRTELLAYLDDYIALGITPVNTYVPWRSPVFIDDDGRICAVGYLIERSVGRALPEAIARTHRTWFLEDIAAAEPAVRAWIAGSGMTLTELASIQPAYYEPAVITWRAWGGAGDLPADGAYVGRAGTGELHGGRMTGPWTTVVTGEDSATTTIVGRGELVRGGGAWTSLYPDGTTRAIGRYVRNRAQGRWTLFHPSGHVAAEGRFDDGVRVGRWRFYDDAAGKVPIAIGSFAADGSVMGTWRHYHRGAVIATTWTETPAQWGDRELEVDGGEGFVLDVAPAADGIRERIHRGTVFGRPLELATYARGADRIYVHAAFGTTTVYDVDGNKLVHDDAGGWSAGSCHWASKRKAIAAAGEVARLHGLLFQDLRRRVGTIQQHDGAYEDAGPRCDEPVAVDGQRAAAIEALFAIRERVRPTSPPFVQRAMLGSESAEAGADDADALPSWREDRRVAATDLVRVLDANMNMYLEWPHVDGPFIDLYATLPGRYSWHWFDGDPRDWAAEDQPRPRR